MQNCVHNHIRLKAGRFWAITLCDFGLNLDSSLNRAKYQLCGAVFVQCKRGMERQLTSPNQQSDGQMIFNTRAIAQLDQSY